MAAVGDGFDFFDTKSTQVRDSRVNALPLLPVTSPDATANTLSGFPNSRLVVEFAGSVPEAPDITGGPCRGLRWKCSVEPLKDIGENPPREQNKNRLPSPHGFHGVRGLVREGGF